MSVSETMGEREPRRGWNWDLAAQYLGSAWFLALALLVAVKLGDAAHQPWSSNLSSACLATFYTMLGLILLTRSPAKAEAQGIVPKVAAFVGTYMPWTIALFPRTQVAALDLCATGCVLVGTIVMLNTIRHLGRSFSLAPQARKVVQTGPYRWIRHPLYLAEEVAILGAVLQTLSLATVLIFVVHIAVQIGRIRYEEDVLGRACADYASYAAVRWRLVPYIW